MHSVSFPHLKISTVKAGPSILSTGKFYGRGRKLDLDMLIERFGPDFVFINEIEISRRLRCKCSHVGGTVRVTAPGKAPRRS